MVTYPSDWTVDSLNNVAKLFDNLRIPVTKSLRTPGNIPYYGANGIQDFVSGYTHDGEFVLIAEDGANDLLNYPVTYVGGKVWVNNHAHVLAGNQSITDTKFLSYLLKKVDYSAILVGGTRAKLNGKVLRNIEITFPEKISEQQSIASVLSDFDEHINNLTELIEKKRAIRDGALEDLISGRTRLDGFDGEWATCKIGDFLEFKNGLNKAKDFFGTGTPIINYMDVYKNRGLTRNLVKGKVELSTDEIKRYEVKKNDVFFTRTSETPEEIGISSVLLESIDDCAFSGFVLRGRPKNKLISPNYCQFCFSIKSVRNDIIKNCTYTTRALTNGTQLSEIDLHFPPDFQEQEAIVSVLTAMEEEIEFLEEERTKMLSIKEGAMDDLLTGRVRLKV